MKKKEGLRYSLEKYMTKIYKKILPDSVNSLNSTEDFIRKLKELKLEKRSKDGQFWNNKFKFLNSHKWNKSNNSGRNKQKIRIIWK